MKKGFRTFYVIGIAFFNWSVFNSSFWNVIGVSLLDGNVLTPAFSLARGTIISVVIGSVKIATIGWNTAAVEGTWLTIV